jgi:hypothetical protein
LPGYRIVGIDCNAIIPSLGAIHCISKEIGVSDPVFISHSKLADSQYSNTSYQVKAYIKNKTGISSAKVFWSTDTAAGFNQLSMTNAGDTFTASIPQQVSGSRVYYYISATSVNGRTTAKPLTAPAGNYRFNVYSPIGIVKTGNGVPGKFFLYQNYPNPFNPSTTIKFDIQKAGNVELKIFDITGREAAVLVKDNISAGSYKIVWSVPSGLSSGAYFYRLSYEGGSQVRKILIIK